jgi:hypothetical protein
MKFAKIILAAAMAVAFGVPVDARGAAYEWYFSDDRNMHFAEATFGEPDTDARLIRFTCQSGVLSVQGPLPNRWMEESEDFGARMRISFSMPDGSGTSSTLKWRMQVTARTMSARLRQITHSSPL